MSVKAAGVWSWPLTPSSAEVKEWVELYLLHSPNTPSRHELKKEHRDNFTFTFTLPQLNNTRTRITYCIHEEIKWTLHFGNFYYISVQIMSSHLLYKSLKIKIRKTIILPLVLYGYKKLVWEQG
jgi:hypothetical protein